MFGVRISKLGSASKLGLIAKAIGILRKYGTDAHVYLPGIGTVSGLTAGNYLDSTGATSASVDNPVGLILDAVGSSGAPVSHTFASGWTLPAGASISGSTAVMSGASGYVWRTTGVFTASEMYSVTFEISGYTAGTIRPYIHSSPVFGSYISGDGTFTQYLTANSANPEFGLNMSGFSGVVNVIGYAKISGIHATQSTTANKPILRRGALNLQDWSENISGATGWASDGMQVGSTVTLPASSGVAFRAYKAGALTPYTAYVASVYIPPAAFWSDPSASFKLTWFGLYVTRTNFTPNTVNAGAGGWITCAVSAAVVSAATTLDFRLENLTASTITCSQPFKVQIEAGITAGDYTPTTSTAASNPSAGKYWWSFDGSNDSLSLSAPLFQMSDDHCVIAGANCTKTASWNTVFGQGGATATQRIQLGIDASTGFAVYYLRDDAATSAQLLSGADLRNQNAVLTAKKTGSTKVLRVNGAQVATNATVLGTTTFTGSSIGSVGPVSGDYFQGSIYPLIGIKGTLSDPDLLVLERFVGQMAGVSI